MKTLNFKGVVLAFLLILPSLSFTPFDVLDDVASAIRSGDSRAVARFFDSNVEIAILDRESSYSKTQAEMILRDFFAKNQVQSFVLKHRGSSEEGSSFGIGALKTSSQTFRVYYFVKQKGSQKVIQEMKFEKQN